MAGVSKTKEVKKNKVKNLPPKNIQLRAFAISPQDPKITTQSASIVELLTKKLNETTAGERVVLLNKDDPSKISDSLPYFDIRNKDKNRIVLGVIMKISMSENVQFVANNLLKQQKFSVAQMKANHTNGNQVYLSHYYFALNNKFLVTNLPMNTTIRGFQAFMNTIIKDHLFEFTPLVETAPEFRIADLKQLSITDPSIHKTTENSTKGIKRKWVILKNSLLKMILKDIKGLDEVEAARVISAKLLLKFIKPKDMSDDDYKKIMGFCLKPISDLENVVFTNKKKQSFSADKLLKTEVVPIDRNEDGFISEPQLWDSMTSFIAKLK